MDSGCPELFEGRISDLLMVLEQSFDPRNLPFLKKLMLSVLGYAPYCRSKLVIHETERGITNVVEDTIYVVKCPRCGAVFLDYVHGYSRYFVCPRCGTKIHL